MTWSPKVAFGLEVTAAALKACRGCFGLRDEISLARAALRYAAHDPKACAQIEWFLTEVRHQPDVAAAALLDFAQGLVPADRDEFEWQKRADLR